MLIFPKLIRITLMVKIRLARLGSKANIFYRIVACEKQLKRSGKFLDIVGFWHPRTNEKLIDKDKLKHWVGRGAIVTKAVENLLI